MTGGDRERDKVRSGKVCYGGSDRGNDGEGLGVRGVLGMVLFSLSIPLQTHTPSFPTPLTPFLNHHTVGYKFCFN